MRYVPACVQGVIADKETEDLFCQRMTDNWENTPDEGKKCILLEERL